MKKTLTLTLIMMSFIFAGCENELPQPKKKPPRDKQEYAGRFLSNKEKRDAQSAHSFSTLGEKLNNRAGAAKLKGDFTASLGYLQRAIQYLDLAIGIYSRTGKDTRSFVRSRRNAEKEIRSLEVKGISSAESPVTDSFQTGLDFASEKMYAESVGWFSKTIESDPLHAKAFYSRGTANLQLKNYVAAQKDLSRAIELDPVFKSGAYNNRGLARQELVPPDHAGAQKDFAMSNFLQGVQKRQRGVVLRSQENYKGALALYVSAEKFFVKAIELEADFIRQKITDYLLNRGDTNVTRGFYVLASLDYRLNQKLSPFELGDADKIVNQKITDIARGEHSEEYDALLPLFR